MNETAPAHTWSRSAILLFLFLPFAAGILLSLLIPRPIIGVISLDDAIYTSTASDIIAQLIYARENPRVRAVVLAVNSPGGTVSDTEAVYGEITRLRKTKPVITFIQGMAASGAYYMAAGSDYIIAQPTSEVGHIGVILTLPSNPLILEDIYTTGPYKLTGYPRDTAMREIETAKQGFLQAVQLGRGERLKIGEDILLRAQVWTGIEAVQMGIIDELGSTSHAYEKAAEMVKISHYEVVNLRAAAGLPEVSSSPFFFQTQEGMLTPYPNKAGIYMLYIPPMQRQP
ncbi:MAG: S49 family peptidase [Anaerolineaceae bacterium]|nr:S49 family peptidase [Anaerolineaceae bacterium]